jgi:alpha-L-fucosidase
MSRLLKKASLLLFVLFFVGFNFTLSNVSLKAEGNSTKQTSQGIEDFKLLKYGMFVHYLASNEYAVDQVANDFDPQKFANDLYSWKVQYIIFTAWHYGMHCLYPSAVMEKNVPGWCSKRDLVGEVIKAVKAKGIKVILYTNPGQGPTFPYQARINTGWNNAPWNPNPKTSDFNFDKWNTFLCSIYDELVTRYGIPNSDNGGAIIDGIYIDEDDSNAKSDQYLDYAKIRNTIKSKNNNIVMLHNFFGSIYTCDFASKETNFNNGTFPENDWASDNTQYAAMMTNNWYATVPLGTNAQLLTPEGMYRYTVLNAAINTTGGGIAWAAGPYPNVVWETGVAEAMTKLGGYVDKYKESIYNTKPSMAYVTIPNSAIDDLIYNGIFINGVATDSNDGKYVYLHTLKPPIGNVLQIAFPENNIAFSKAELIPNEKALTLNEDDQGYSLTLPDGVNWDAVDTVIRLTVTNKVASSSKLIQSSSKATSIAKPSISQAGSSSAILNISSSIISSSNNSNAQSPASNSKNSNSISVDKKNTSNSSFPYMIISIALIVGILVALYYFIIKKKS